MCKLVAMVNLGKEIPVGKVQNIKNMFEHILYINSYKNRDGTGIIRVDNGGECYTYKRGLPSPDFLQIDVAKNLLSITANTKFLVGHTRYGTVGGVSDKNAHPFRHGNIILVQNGTSHYGYRNLVPDKQAPNSIAVDSEHVCWAISEQGAKKTFEEYEGAGVFIWYDLDSKSLNIIKNDERDLHIAKINGTDVYMITTDWAALEYASNRANLDISEVKEFPNDILFTYHINGSITKDDSVKVNSEYCSKYIVKSYSYGKSSTNNCSQKGVGFVGKCSCCDASVYDFDEYMFTDEGDILCEDCATWAPEYFGIEEKEFKKNNPKDSSNKLEAVV